MVVLRKWSLLKGALKTKNRLGRRFCWMLGFCCCVNLPLLHRLGAGMAKVKIAGKKDGVGHDASRKVGLTITTTPAHWQGVCLLPVLPMLGKWWRQTHRRQREAANLCA
jgi:hypothetical protein